MVNSHFDFFIHLFANVRQSRVLQYFNNLCDNCGFGASQKWNSFKL